MRNGSEIERNDTMRYDVMKWNGIGMEKGNGEGKGKGKGRKTHQLRQPSR